MIIINKVKSLFLINEPEKYYDEFKNKTYEINIYRAKIVAYLFIILESVSLILSFIHLENYINQHIILYIIMILGMSLYLVIFNRSEKTINNVKIMRLAEVSFISFIMLWSVAVSLLDQLLYGQVIVYIVTLMSIAVTPILEPISAFFIYCIVQLIFIAALPHYQKTTSILSGHIINTTTFVIISLVISRILYKSHLDNFLYQKEIQEKNNELSETNRKLEQANDDLQKLSDTDSLTGLLNRRKFTELMEFKLKQCKKHIMPITVIMIDIDYFKEYNDNYGHLAGDNCLRHVASVLSNSVKDTSDIVARYGGEEFIIVMSNVKKEDAYLVAENIRFKVESLCILHDFSKVSKCLTISLGVYTTIPNKDISVDKIIKIADNALYEAKLMNKNTVVSA